MSAPVTQDAAFRYVESGQTYMHYLGCVLRRPVSNPVQNVFSHQPSDYTAAPRRVAVGSPAYDLTAELRYDGQIGPLQEFLLAARRGASIEYLPSLSNPSQSYPCTLIDASAIRPDAQMWQRSRYQCEVRLRRIDGGTWESALNPALLYYRAGNPMPGQTFTRSGAVGSYVDELGVLQSPVAADIIRTSWRDMDANGVMDTPLVLIEAASANLFTQSDDLTHSDWADVGLSAQTADQAIGPTGALTLDELVEDSGTSAHRVSQTKTVTANATYACSGWFIAGTRTWGVILVGENGAVSTNYYRAWFNLTTGVVGTTAAAGTGAFERAYVEDWTHIYPGLYRCVAVGSVGNSATSVDATLGMGSADGVLSYAGDGSSSLFVGGAQLEDDAQVASTYMPTTTGSATRATETLSVPWAYLPQEGSWLFDFVEAGTAETPDYGLFQLGGSTVSSGAYLSVFTSGTVGRYRVTFNNGVDSNVTVVIGASGEVSFGDRVRIRVYLSPLGAVTLGVKINDEDEVTASASAPAAGLPLEWGEGSGARLYFGSLGTTNQGLTALAAVKSYGRSMSMTELIAA